MSSLCQICWKDPSKYRCPSCGISSCSLNCSQLHRSQCIQNQPSTKSITNNPLKKESVKREDQEPRREPFESFIADSEVEQLFTRYPELQLQLRQIYKSTLESGHAERLNDARRRGASYRGRGRGSHALDRSDRRPWTPERGFAHGLECLRMQQQSDSSGAEGLKELSALILKRYPVEAQ